VIASSRFGFTYSNKPVAKGLSFVFIKWDAIELAGNVLTLVNELSGSKKNQNGRYELLGVNYFQYIKTAIDFRYNTIYDQNNATVFRLFTGVMLPYGNSPVYTPFEKRFFVGGANSLRAWRPRTIGPGNYLVDNQIDHSGDIKIEANAEFRFNIYNHWLEGAVFADAGNVWSTKPKANGTGAEFLWDNFYKQLAMNTGFGTRLNFGVILLRFDFGLPIHDPTYAEPDRWVIRKFNSTWFFNNLYFNFGIGYPF
jgi:outer membrane protein assembly factor BamA